MHFRPNLPAYRQLILHISSKFSIYGAIFEQIFCKKFIITVKRLQNVELKATRPNFNEEKERSFFI
jgi:hypothetical protein